MSGTVLVVGSGIAGLHAAIECERAGARVIVVERDAVIGGRLVAALTDRSSVGEVIDGAPLPKLARLAELDSIEYYTLCAPERIEGEAGEFHITLRERARFVSDRCTRCNHCHRVCPVVVPNEYDAGLSFRKAIHTPFPQTMPPEFAIDIESCLNTPPNYLPCNRCIEVCDDDAIHFDIAPEQTRALEVGAVILATGLGLEQESDLIELGYGTHPDILTSWELQRLLVAPGPSGGFVTRPSNEEYPDRVLLVLNTLSPFGAEISSAQLAALAAQHISGIEVLVLEQRRDSADTERLEGAVASAGAALCWGALHEIKPTGEAQLAARYTDLATGRTRAREFDVIVLGLEPRPPADTETLAQIAGVSLGEDGYIGVSDPDDTGAATSRAGVYVAGCASGPMSVAATIAQAGAAARGALRHLRAPAPGVAAEAAPGTDAAEPGAPVPEARRQQQMEQVLYALMALAERSSRR